MKAFQHTFILFLILVLANLSSIRIAYSEEAPGLGHVPSLRGGTTMQSQR